MTRSLPRAAEVALEGAGVLLMAPMWIWWATWKGGYPPAVFLAGIGYLALVALALRIFAPPSRLGRAGGWALGALAALTIWTLVSLLWGEDGGAVEVAGARQILLFGSFALPLLWPPSARALVVGIATVPLVALCGAVSAWGAALGDPGTLLDGRLADPTGYANASAALMAIGVLTSIVIASRGELAVTARAAALASCGALLGTFVVTQSRGGLGALAAVLLLAFVLLPGRLRLLIPVGIVAVSIWIVLDPLLEVRRAAVDGGDVYTALREAARVLTFTSFALAAIGALYATLDARVEVGEKTVRRATAALGAAVVGVLLVATIVLLASGPNIGGWVSERVDDFKTPDYGRLESEPTRFTGDLGSNRYDYWRVSVDVFVDRPLTGSGAGNFIAPFLERRHADKSTLYSHSIWLGTLAELGAVGFLALLAFLVALVVALVRAVRRRDAPRWAVVTAALPIAYVFTHGTFDWITTFPVVMAPALALAAAAAAGGQTEAGPLGAATRSASLAVITALVGAAILAGPLLVAARLADRGATSWQERPAAAVADLEDAAKLDPLAAAPYVRLGIVAIELKRPALAADAFRSALERDPSAWYPELQLGLLAAAAGERRSSLEALESSLSRNPRELEAKRVLRLVRARELPDPRVVQRRILRQADG